MCKACTRSCQPDGGSTNSCAAPPEAAAASADDARRRRGAWPQACARGAASAREGLRTVAHESRPVWQQGCVLCARRGSLCGPKGALRKHKTNYKKKAPLAAIYYYYCQNFFCTSAFCCEV